MYTSKKIVVKSFDGKPRAYISPKADGLKDCYVDNRLNGESTLEFMLPATSEKIIELTPECQILANNRIYSLLKDDAIDTVRDEKNTLWVKFMAVECWYGLDFEYIEPSLSNDPSTPVPSDLAVIIVSGGSNLSGGLYSTGSAVHALYAVLDGSDWSVGTVDVSGIHDLEAEKSSRLQVIKNIQEIWGGYLIWDSVNKVVHLRDANTWQNYTGFQIRYRKNLKHITRTQSNRLITKMYCFGHDDLDIASVNSGIRYLTNFSFTPREYIGIYKNQDIYDVNELKSKAMEELALVCHPRYLYKVKVVDLRTLPEYEREDFELGDMTDVVDPDVAPDSPRPRIIRHKFNLFQPWNCEIDIGDPEERLIEMLKAAFNTTGFVDSKFNGSGKMSGRSIEDLTVTDSNIDYLTITGSKIQNLTITGSKIANATITDAKISDLSADKITAGTIETQISIISPYISGGEIEGGTITGALIRTDEDGERLQFSGAGIVSYSGGSIKHGFAVQSPWNEIKLYTSNSESMVMSAFVNQFDLTLFGNPVLNYSYGSMKPYGIWDCSGAGFATLKNSVGQYYATQDWVEANFEKKPEPSI